MPQTTYSVHTAVCSNTNQLLVKCIAALHVTTCY